MSEIGVVIQGPIKSIGRTLTNLNKIDFDATSNIKLMLKESLLIGATPIVVTWENENIEKFTPEEKKFIRVLTFPKVSLRKSVRNDWNHNNKYRQYFSTYAGLQFLSQEDVKYVIKVRSDNLINIKEIANFACSLDRNIAEAFIFTPVINLGRPHMYYDFYAFGSVKKIQGICETMLFEKEITANVHYDVFYKQTKKALNSKFRLGDLTLIYPIYPFYTKRQLSLIRTGLKNVFRPLPKEIWLSVTWRGERFGSAALKETYRFSDSSEIDILGDFDVHNFRIRKYINIDIACIPSFFITSKFETRIQHGMAKIRFEINRLANKYSNKFKFK